MFSVLAICRNQYRGYTSKIAHTLVIELQEKYSNYKRSQKRIADLKIHEIEVNFVNRKSCDSNDILGPLLGAHESTAYKVAC